MVKVYIETDDLTKEQLVELLLEKDKQIAEFENSEGKLKMVYETYKVSDTYKIHNDKQEGFIMAMEQYFLALNSN